MGAADFETLSVGKTVAEAYRSAVEQAQWEHGHGGYTGTIAEKSGCHLITLPPRLSAAKFVDWVKDDMAQYESLKEATEYARNDLAWVRANMKRGVEGRAERIGIAQRQLSASTTAFNRFWKKVPPELHSLVRGAVLIYNDKWGPALAIELRPSEVRRLKYPPERKRGQKVFLFCGWASS